MSAVAKTLAKPQLRGLLQDQIKRNLAIAIGLGAASGIAMKFLVCEPRKKKYAEFYKNYDPEAEFERMKALGLFQSG